MVDRDPLLEGGVDLFFLWAVIFDESNLWRSKEKTLS